MVITSLTAGFSFTKPETLSVNFSVRCQRRCRRHAVSHQQTALVFHWDQTARNDLEQQPDAGQHADKAEHGRLTVMQKKLNPGDIPIGYFFKTAVKRPEESRRFLFAAGFPYQQRTKRRCQRQGHKSGNQNRYGDGYGKLAVHHTGHAAQKRDWQKHR